MRRAGGGHRDVWGETVLCEAGNKPRIRSEQNTRGGGWEQKTEALPSSSLSKASLVGELSDPPNPLLSSSVPKTHKEETGLKSMSRESWSAWCRLMGGKKGRREKVASLSS